MRLSMFSDSTHLSLDWDSESERTLDWGFDKGTEWQHDRESRYMPVKMLTKLNAEKMDLRAIGSTWRSKSKTEAKDSCE
ncbi:hypothetical protein F2Q69_00055877 [Brassica cretica]|uniref:Uncharacterized protein n=2 Tax=Brassica cretica TaxID=69181 RepID=A0A3N6SJY6_BRACR|nr:hypothetical protein F2Q69_00055877 [Brassica cretica]KAF3596838.1 hypothetical protein DY000_02025432 [Brassica cretica]